MHNTNVLLLLPSAFAPLRISHHGN